MKADFVAKFLNVYENELFPNSENTYEKIKADMENFNKPNAEIFTDFPFARQKFARFLTIFGLEIFYVWDKYIITMYALKVILCLAFGLMITSNSFGLMIFGAMLMMFALLIIQVIIFKKMPEICKRYNNKLLLKALDNPDSVKSRQKYFSIIRKIFFLVRSLIGNKDFRNASKELRDSFYVK